MIVLVRLSVAVVTIMAESNLGRRGFILFRFHSPSLREDRAGTQGRSLEAGLKQNHGMLLTAFKNPGPSAAGDGVEGEELGGWG